MAWQFWIDRGGTFTDVVGRKPDGGLVTAKLLSENPGRYADAAVAGMRQLLGVAPGAAFPARKVEAIKMGTTVATNALLERKGERTLLAITAGFADALRIGTQHRPRLFDLNIVLPEMLYSEVVEILERVSATGDIVTPLDEAAARTTLTAAFKAGFRSVAIVLMHGYRFTAHEARVAAIAKELGFTQVSVSHEVSALMKLVGRGDTSVADAYLSPILRRYVDQVAAAVSKTRLQFMQSSGGLVDAHHFQGKDAVLSGPAGGVVGVTESARRAGLTRIIGFDMGGTSTDVCHFAGQYERSFETTVAGIRLRSPMLRIHTVAAGGGSLLIFDGLRFRVGPESAGANPGPASYRRGGPLTVTDANVLLGKIQPDFFPKVFGVKGDEPLDADIVRQKFAKLAEEVAATGPRRPPEELAEGYLAIAVDNMARAIKKISVERGYDITKYTLACFGGAGGQHACLVADALSMDQVLIHPLAGVLSAYGMGLARLRAVKTRTVELPLSDHRAIARILDELEAAARQEVDAQGAESATAERRAHLRYQGTDTTLVVPFEAPELMARAFAEAHRAQFGFVMNRPLICETAEVEAVGDAEDIAAAATLKPQKGLPKVLSQVNMRSGGADHDTPLYARAKLGAGARIMGPAIIIEDNATTVVEPGWAAEVSVTGDLLLKRTVPRPPRTAVGTSADPLMIEVFNNLFMSIAEQMGGVLQFTAQSVNIKERLDFSCAVFDGDGNLIANAPHMPVHLGSMGESVRAVARRHGNDFRDGDAYVLNNPYDGGTHLPDITVITPVFLPGDAAPLFFTASRGHHADVGGITPGSMPPMSRSLNEEGVLLDNLLLVRSGEFQEAALRAALTAGPYPARNVDMNLADLRAQAAACAKGVIELRKMVADFGRDTVVAYMGHVQDHAEESVRRVVGRLASGSFTCPMDDGGKIKVTVTVDARSRSATVDFTGSSRQRATNFNAPMAVCRAAVLYVFRTLVAEDIPMNEGCLRPINIVIPEGSLLNPRFPAAVVAGNVETSQIICDAIYGALGVLAAAQGTMNNFTFGNAKHQYYETIAGGAGAGPDFDGASAVHTHMTNSRLTDPEVLEWRFPVRVERFALRRGSGGAGAHRGGDGIERRIRFLEPMTAAILSGRRTHKPFGLKGGGEGAAGETEVERGDGRKRMLGPTDETQVDAGDCIVIRTPGGGGYGVPGTAAPAKRPARGRRRAANENRDRPRS